MRILGFERSVGAVSHYRIVQPLYKLQQHNLAEVLTIHQGNAQNLEFVTEKILESDIILFQRPQDDRWFNFLKIAQKHGKIVILDCDDHPFELSPLNPAYRHYGVTEVQYKWPDGKTTMLWKDGENGFAIEDNISRRDYFKASFKRADMVSTTTDTLKKFFTKINQNTVVLPNVIDFDLYPRIECVKKDIRILWQGGASHYEDLFMIADTIKRIVKKYNNVKFVFFGDMRFYGLFKEIKDKIEWHSWVQHVAYPYKLATLNPDINLCPIIDNEFNRHKSAIKYLEASVFKIPTIASDIPPYIDVMSDQDGMLVHKDGWYDAIENLIKDESKRKRLGEKAYDKTLQEYDADKKAHLWKDAYEVTLKKEVAELVEV